MFAVAPDVLKVAIEIAMSSFDSSVFFAKPRR